MVSNVLSDLKKRIASGETDSVREDCENYIHGLIIEGMNTAGNVALEYCAYAVALGVKFVKNSDSIMFVMLREGKTSLNIDAINVVNYIQSDVEVLFIIAHEVSHLLYGHLSKYGEMFDDEVVGVFLNIATDVEINTNLIERVFYPSSTWSDTTRKAIPSTALTISTVSRMLGIDASVLSKRRITISLSKYSSETFADVIYKYLNKRCVDVLGHSIVEILYKITINGSTSFKEEVFKIADGGNSSIFTIKDKEIARRFCIEIASYLKRCPNFIRVVCDCKDPSQYSDCKGDEGIEKGTGEISGNVSSMGLSQHEIADLLKQVNDFKEVLMKNANMKGRGVTGSSHLEEVDFIKKETFVPWQSVLRNRMYSLSLEKEYTKKRINRRQPDRLELSGQKQKHKMKLFIGVDESGSISSDEYNYFLSEIINIVKNFECEVTVLEFTGEVDNKSTFSSKKFVEQCSKKKGMFKSRNNGGTSYQPVFTELNEIKNTDLVDSLTIIFTDGEGEREVDFGKVKNRLWVITNKGLLSCSEKQSNVFPVVII